ncbi:unnamed protein product [Ranitomeya imitator]|uniref:Uncharacterized protein n=1 Tax=Ranitomeya imitator TaxID=111125 RepID=A0ABN9LJS4_9NEOB|nr:unnamed protein product [Ranitomeya imitator]
MNKEWYQNVLQEQLLPTIQEQFGAQQCLFQHDGAPCHKAKVAFLVAITLIRRVSELATLSCRVPFLNFHQDKVVLRPSQSFLPKVISSFHVNEDLVLPSLCPAPLYRMERALHTLDLVRALRRCAYTSGKGGEQDDNPFNINPVTWYKALRGYSESGDVNYDYDHELSLELKRQKIQREFNEIRAGKYRKTRRDWPLECNLLEIRAIFYALYHWHSPFPRVVKRIKEEGAPMIPDSFGLAKKSPISPEATAKMSPSPSKSSKSPKRKSSPKAGNPTSKKEKKMAAGASSPQTELPVRHSKVGQSKKKGPRTPSPPPPAQEEVSLSKKHKDKHKAKERNEERVKDVKERGREAEKHRDKKDRQRSVPIWGITSAEAVTKSSWPFSQQFFPFKRVFTCCFKETTYIFTNTREILFAQTCNLTFPQENFTVNLNYNSIGLLLLHVTILPSPQDTTPHPHSPAHQFRGTPPLLVVEDHRPLIIKEPLRHPPDGHPPHLIPPIHHHHRGGEVHPNIDPQSGKKEDMKGKEQLVRKTDVGTGGTIVEEEKIRKEKETTGSQVALETTEMNENLVMAVIVETSEITVTEGRLRTPGRAVRLEILVTIEILKKAKKAESRRIPVLLVTLMIIESGTIVSLTGKMSSMMNAATEEVTGEMNLRDLKPEMNLGMTPVMNPEVRPEMIVMAEHGVVHLIRLKKVVGETEAPRWIATAAAVTTKTGIQGAVIPNARDMTTANRGEIPHLIADMGKEKEGNESEIKDRHPQHNIGEEMMMNEKKEEMSVE